jgi:hypothetical protein
MAHYDILQTPIIQGNTGGNLIISDAINNINWTSIPIIATAARLLNKELTLQNEYLLWSFF